DGLCVLFGLLENSPGLLPLGVGQVKGLEKPAADHGPRLCGRGGGSRLRSRGLGKSHSRGKSGCECDFIEKMVHFFSPSLERTRKRGKELRRSSTVYQLLHSGYQCLRAEG